MAKKKPVSTTKTTGAKKKTTAQKTTPNKKKAAASAPKPAAAKKKTPQGEARIPAGKAIVAAQSGSLPLATTAELEKLAQDATHESHILELPNLAMRTMLVDIQDKMEEFLQISNDNLTLLQRRRKIGPGGRNYGFIKKTAELAQANPQFAPFFSVPDLRTAIRNIDLCRDLVLALQAFTRAVSNTMMVFSDDAFSMSLIYYNMVKEMARRGNPEAIELFRTLRIFFRRSRRTTEEPTITQTERDVHAILTHKKDGEIIIKGEAPHLTGGVTTVVDDVHKSKAKIKETEEEQFDN